MCACTLLLLPAAACFLAGRAVCARQPDYHAAVLIGAAQARNCLYCDFDACIHNVMERSRSEWRGRSLDARLG